MAPPSGVEQNMESAARPMGQDHFSALPPELLNMIFAYLYPDHNLQQAYDNEATIRPRCHSLDFLAQASHSIRAAVDEWARSFLLQHLSSAYDQRHPVIPFPASLQPKPSPDRVSTTSTLRIKTQRYRLLDWSTTHCVFCGQYDNRCATFANGLACCIRCNDAEWPEKLTKTAAKKDYMLKESDLFAAPRVPVPGLRCGTEDIRGRLATMFIKEDLQVLADRIRGAGWEVKRAEKASSRESRRKQRVRIESEMKQKQQVLQQWQSHKWEDINDPAVEVILREILRNAPHGWYDLARSVRKEFLGDLPSNWFNLPRSERKQTVVEYWRVKDLPRALARFKDFVTETQIDEAEQTLLFSNEPPGWFEMTLPERQEYFDIISIDRWFEWRIVEDRIAMEEELCNGDEPPGWFEMTVVEKGDYFVITAMPGDECFTAREVARYEFDRYFNRRVKEQEMELEAELCINEPLGWFEMTEVEREEYFHIIELDATLGSWAVEDKIELELFGDPPPSWAEMTPAQRKQWFIIELLK